MKLNKRLFCAASLALATLSLASCTDKEAERNSAIPTLQNLDTTQVVANVTKNIENNLTLDKYYTLLRSQGYSVVTDKLREVVYAAEYKAIQDIIKSDYAHAASETKKLISYELEDEDDLECNEHQYSELREKILTALHSNVASAIYGTSDIKTYDAKTVTDLNTAKAKYIDTQGRKGITITDADLEVLTDSAEIQALNPDFKSTTNIYIKNINSIVEKGAVRTFLLDQAELISTRNALFQIANKEYIENPDDETKQIKNSNYILEESKIESGYNDTYKTFGTYKAIIVQFNTKKEADDAVAQNKLSANATDEEKREYYSNLYKTYYNADDAELDEESTFVVNKYENELSELNSSVQTLITTTLEDGDCLTTPRYVGSKYVMAYRISTEYLYTNDEGEQKEFSDIDEKDELYDDIINDIMYTNGTSYKNTHYQNLLKDAYDEGLFKIYDPLFDYKFENSNSKVYEATKSTEFTAEKQHLIFEFGDAKYTTNEFLTDASKIYASSIITTYYQQEYVYTNFKDYFLDSETHDSNEETLKEQIKSFSEGKLSSYPKDMGKANYLLNAYGYDNEADIMRYYYDAKSILSSYLADSLYGGWVNTEGQIDQDYQNDGALKHMFDLGNQEYKNLLGVNLDHILINVDFNGDGTPDDPATLFKNNPEKKADFENAVVELARIIYIEALQDEYADNDLLDILKHIKDDYENDEKLLSNPEKSWSDYKKYNFLLTVESLGDINQSSVNNFVKPFADYVRGIYKTATAEGSKVDSSYDHGIFYLYDTKTKEGGVYNSIPKAEETEGEETETTDDSTKITLDTLCETVYGYHMIVFNSKKTPSSLKYTESNDKGTQKEIQLLIENLKDFDKDNITVTVDSYNEGTDSSSRVETASFNQFLIYYVQTKNGATNTLDSTILSTLQSMYKDIIAQYSTTNFQSFLLLKELGITSASEFVAQAAISAEIEYLKNQVISYDSESKYASWVETQEDGTLKLNWARPEYKYLENK